VVGIKAGLANLGCDDENNLSSGKETPARSQQSNSAKNIKKSKEASTYISARPDLRERDS